MPSTIVLSGCALLAFVGLGCSVSVGAGAQATAGKGARPSVTVPTSCTGFESCQLIYTDAVARAVSCRAERADSDGCEAEERLVALSYSTLRDQTKRELEALRAQVRDCAAK